MSRTYPVTRVEVNDQPGRLIESSDAARFVVWPADDTSTARLMWYGTTSEALTVAESITFLDSTGAWMDRYDVDLPGLPDPYSEP